MTRTRAAYGIPHHDPGPGGPAARPALSGTSTAPAREARELVGVAGRDGQGQRIRTGARQRPDRAHHDRPITKQAAADEVGDRLRGEARRTSRAQVPDLSCWMTLSVRSSDLSAVTMPLFGALTSKIIA